MSAMVKLLYQVYDIVGLLVNLFEPILQIQAEKYSITSSQFSTHKSVTLTPAKSITHYYITCVYITESMCIVCGLSNYACKWLPAHTFTQYEHFFRKSRPTLTLTLWTLQTRSRRGHLTPTHHCHTPLLNTTTSLFLPLLTLSPTAPPHSSLLSPSHSYRHTTTSPFINSTSIIATHPVLTPLTFSLSHTPHPPTQARQMRCLPYPLHPHTSLPPSFHSSCNVVNFFSSLVTCSC